MTAVAVHGAEKRAESIVIDLRVAARVQVEEAITAGRLPARPNAEMLGMIAGIVADVGRRAG